MVLIDALDSLPERIESHVKLFDSMLELIPTKYYMTNKTNNPEDNPYAYNKRKKAPKQQVKEMSKKAKKAKLDPENQKSITELQNERAEQERAAKEQQEEVKEETAEGTTMEKADFSGLTEQGEKQESSSTEKNVPTPMVRSDIVELHARLQRRIAELRQKRNAPAEPDDKHARNRNELLAARRRKREERKKALQAKKQKGKQGPKETIVAQNAESEKTNTVSADTVKMDGDLFFGKVELGGQQQKKKKGPTDAKSQLKKIEAKQQKLEKLRAENQEKAEALEEKEEWQKAIALASGEKVRDDPKLLKKTIKRTEQQKKKSAEAWKARLEKVKQDEQNRIKKREENIRKRQMEKKSKKGKKKPRPGFH